MTSEGAYVMCRTCLNYSFPFSNIFKELLGEGYVYEVLMDVCQLEVRSDNGLPEYVCFECHKNLSKLHYFKMQTHESNATLHHLKIKHEIKSSAEEKADNKDFVPNPTKKIEPPSSFTSSTPNSDSCLKSTSRTMKECYVHLSRCDQLQQDGHSPKMTIKREKEDPAYLGDNESGNIQGADMEVNIKSEKEDPSYLGDNYSRDIQGADVQVPVALVGEGKSLSTSKAANKQKIIEVTLQANTQGVVKLNEVLCCENLFSNGKEIEGDDIEIHEHKPYSEDASLTGFSSHLHFMDNTAKGVGNLTIRDGDPPSDGAYIEAEHQDIKGTSEDGCVTVDSNLKHCEGNPEDIIPRLLERSVHRGVELNLDRSYDEKSLDNVGFKIQDRQHLEEMQFECEIFENKFQPDYTCRKPRAIYETQKLINNSKYSLNECSSSECIDRRSVMREIDKEAVKSDNVVSKTYRKKSNVLEDSHVQLTKAKNRDLSDILVCDHCRKEFKEKADLLKHLVEHSGRSNFGRISAKTEGKGNVVLHVSEPTNNIVLYTSDSTKKRVTKKFKRRLGTRNQWKCNWCGKEFASASKLKFYERVHSGEQPFSCKYCSKKFLTKGTLSRHELTHPGVKPFSCSYCSQMFNQKMHLKRHQLTHTGVKPFTCKFCSKSFCQESDLNRHELTHTGVKPFLCKFCSKKFNLKSNLNKHERIHTGVKPYPCKFCSKKFNGKYNLTTHELIHTGVKPYMCGYCSKTFRQKAHLKTHELTHTGVKHFHAVTAQKIFPKRAFS